MSRPLDELLNSLTLLIGEHRRLLAEAERHQAAIRSMDLPAMDASRVRQDAIRARIAAMEERRRLAAEQCANGLKGRAVTLTRLAEMHPAYRGQLLLLRDELRDVIGQISQRTHVAGRVAGAVLGHLNTVVRLVVGGAQQGGVYTKRGIPKLSPRIGIIETVG
jgi:hypothetical protein